MKPISLVISGWGPYGSVESIDFTQFNNSIFLITGITGAGKTTIFDGITYALYASVSGSFRKKDCLRSDYALDDVETFVELRFLHRGEEYVVKRSPSYSRKKRRGDGYTETKEEATLVLPDNTMIVGNNEVNSKIVNILGITYEQYKKVSMIAQGEFQTLLSEKTDKRVEAFRNIFNTFIYNKLEEISGERARTIKSKINENDITIDGIMSTMSLDEEKYIDCIGKKDYIEFADKINDELEEDEAVIVSYNERLNHIEKASNDLISKINTEEINDRNIKKANELIQKNDELLEELQVVKEERQRLSDRSIEIEELKIKLFQAQSALTNFEKINKLDSSVEKSKVEAEALKLQIDRLKQDVDTDKKSIELNTEYITQLGDIDKKISDITIDLNNLENKKKVIDNLIEKNKENIIASNSLKKYQDEYEKILNQKNIVKKELDDLNDNYNKSLIGIVVSRFFAEDKPCPVCGSMDHPQVAPISKNLPTEEDLEVKQKEYERISQECDVSHIRAREQKVQCDTLIKKYNELLEDYNLKDIVLEDEAQKIAEDYNLQERISAQLHEDRKNRELKNHEIEDLNKRIEKNLLDIDTLNVKLEEISHEIIKNQEIARETREGISKEFKDTLEVEEYVYLTKISLETYEKKKEKIENIYQKLNTKIQSNKGIIEELKSSIMSNDSVEDKIVILKQELEQFNAEKEDINKNRDELLSKIKANRSGVEKILKQYKINATLYEKYGVVGKISSLFNGNNNNKIRLEHYIMSSYFDDMIMAANKRLEIMSGGIYKIFRVSKVLDGRKKDILELEVLDCQIGKKRPVTTLSGGEQFQVALAMALGMSDIIQSSVGGIELDVLFIDEGFATLDSGARQLAIETLIKLTKDDISVGIISHVEELRERIDNNIQIIKGVNGSYILS